MEKPAMPVGPFDHWRDAEPMPIYFAGFPRRVAASCNIYSTFHSLLFPLI
jgi:hypothetical protein